MGRIFQRSICIYVAQDLMGQLVRELATLPVLDKAKGGTQIENILNKANKDLSNLADLIPSNGQITTGAAGGAADVPGGSGTAGLVIVSQYV